MNSVQTDSSLEQDIELFTYWLQVPNISIPSEPDIPLEQSSITDVPYTCIKTDVLDQETYDATMNFFVEEEANFSAVSTSRKVLYFGDHGYKYSKSHHKASPIPEKLQNLMNCLKSKMPEMNGNSLLITCYDSEKDFWKDDETWINPASDIYTLSLGAERTMRFTHEDIDKEQIDVSLPDSSLLTFSKKSQEFWKHAITADESISLKRYSITVRDVKPYYMNSTAGIGDSNTADLRFGPNKGSLGIWLPGERINAGRIENIPAPENLLPNRNLVIHTGLNDHNREIHEKLDILVGKLDTKCKAIALSYPKMKIYVSLLLPTKDKILNAKVNKFNNLLETFVNCKITHMNLVNHEGVFADKFGRPHHTDNIHFGSVGIRTRNC